MIVSLKPLAATDMPLIADWLSRPHVAQRWRDVARNLAEIESFLASTCAAGFVIVANGRPAGFVQSYDCRADPDPYWRAKVPPGAWGFDLFIGEEALLRTGVALAAIEELAAWLRRRGCVLMIVDPAVGNLAAIRLYEKAGFRIVATLADHPEGGNLLMTRRIAAEHH